MVSEQQAKDSEVEAYILQVLDDFKEHDWDEAMIEVDEGFEKAGMRLYERQSETCLYGLVRRGDVVENWDGDFATLKRVKLKPATKEQPRLFE